MYAISQIKTVRTVNKKLISGKFIHRNPLNSIQIQLILVQNWNKLLLNSTHSECYYFFQKGIKIAVINISKFASLCE